MKSFTNIIFISLILLLSCKEKEDSILENLIEDYERIYASSDYKQVESFAKVFDSSLKILLVRSQNVNIDGSSKFWKYELVSTDKLIIYYFTRTYKFIGFDSTGIIKDGNAVITDKWINSNMALSVAENNGGKIFRNKHTNCQISASLSKPLISKSVPLWYIKYNSSSQYLYVVINAITGEFISN